VVGPGSAVMAQLGHTWTMTLGRVSSGQRRTHSIHSGTLLWSDPKIAAMSRSELWSATSMSIGQVCKIVTGTRPDEKRMGGGSVERFRMRSISFHRCSTSKANLPRGKICGITLIPQWYAPHRMQDSSDDLLGSGRFSAAAMSGSMMGHLVVIATVARPECKCTVYFNNGC
jgi:hypothetical protein